MEEVASRSPRSSATTETFGAGFTSERCERTREAGYIPQRARTPRTPAQRDHLHVGNMVPDTHTPAMPTTMRRNSVLKALDMQTSSEFSHRYELHDRENANEYHKRSGMYMWRWGRSPLSTTGKIGSAEHRETLASAGSQDSSVTMTPRSPSGYSMAYDPLSPESLVRDAEIREKKSEIYMPRRGRGVRAPNHNILASPPFGSDRNDNNSIISDNSSFSISEKQNRALTLGYMQTLKKFPGKMDSHIFDLSSNQDEHTPGSVGYIAHKRRIQKTTEPPLPSYRDNFETESMVSDGASVISSPTSTRSPMHSRLLQESADSFGMTAGQALSRQHGYINPKGRVAQRPSEVARDVFGAESAINPQPDSTSPRSVAAVRSRSDYIPTKKRLVPKSEFTMAFDEEGAQTARSEGSENPEGSLVTSRSCSPRSLRRPAEVPFALHSGEQFENIPTARITQPITKDASPEKRVQVNHILVESANASNGVFTDRSTGSPIKIKPIPAPPVDHSPSPTRKFSQRTPSRVFSIFRSFGI